MKKIEIRAENGDKVLNIVSRQLPEISYSYANKLLRQKDIRVNGVKISENLNVSYNDIICLFVSDSIYNTKEENLNVVYEDNILVVVFKPKGIEVTGEAVNLQDKVKKFFNDKTLSALNRLDRNTEGLVIFARGNDNLKLLKSAMKAGEILKVYIAEVVGLPKWNELNAINYLVKDEEKSEVKIFDKPVKDSVKIESKFTVLNRSSGGTSLVQIIIHNGKTHQIRAQLAFLGFPIVGDGKYGDNIENKKFKAKTQKLTAVKLIFNFKESKLKYLNNLNLEVKPSWLN